MPYYCFTFGCFFVTLTFRKTLIKKFFHKDFSFDNNLSSKLIKNNQKIRNYKEILLFVISLMFIIYIYIYIYKLKLATLVEGNPKAPFSIATTSRCRGGCNSILWIAPFLPLILIL